MSEQRLKTTSCNITTVMLGRKQKSWDTLGPRSNSTGVPNQKKKRISSVSLFSFLVH